jgi:hypothetical protein
MPEPTQPSSPTDQPAASAAAVAGAHGKIDHPTPDLAEAMARGFEPRDINLRGLFIFLGTLIVALVVVLFAIYGIMKALVDHDRTHDPLGTPVSISQRDVYAPLQPSIGHPTEDWQDMETMRAQTQAVLSSSGISPTTGRRYITIADAMDKVLPLLVISPHPVTEPKQPTYEEGSHEGTYVGSAEWPPAMAGGATTRPTAGVN